jgi:hypothetical protein
VFAEYQTSISSAETAVALQYIIEAFMRAEYTAVLLSTASAQTCSSEVVETFKHNRKCLGVNAWYCIVCRAADAGDVYVQS